MSRKDVNLPDVWLKWRDCLHCGRPLYYCNVSDPATANPAESGVLASCTSCRTVQPVPLDAYTYTGTWG